MSELGALGPEGEPHVSRRTICVDFDGVIHRYDTPWVAPHVIPDRPVAGAISWLHRMIQSYDVVILTTRARTWRGRRAVRRWLKEQAGCGWYEAPGYRGLEDVRVTDRKPPALIYLDDRAVRFDGENFPAESDVRRARPWHKKGGKK